MIHLGDITKISGYDAPVVDVIIGGSPCQDLSVAGKRAGLAGQRSGLFMEQIRIVKEMRARGGTNDDVRPRYMVWENVPGAFSSNGGKDFAAVLEEAIRVIEPEAPDVPVPEKGWPTSGCFMGDKWSVAWRVLDAQFWGVPQRRRRIALVADFGGLSASEILFVRKSLSGNPEPGEPKGKEAAGDAAAGSGTADCEADYLKSYGWPLGFRPENVRVYEETATTLCCGTRAGFCNGVLIPVAVHDARGNGEGRVCPTLTGDHENRVTDYTALVCEPVCYGVDCRNATEYPELNGTIQAKAGGGFSLNCNQVVRVKHIVRRLTPLECERLQGYPDGWSDIGEWVDSKGKKHKEADSPRYKALGNSIALPPWKWVLKRLCACYERDATMASLFDGIGGFPLIWEQLNGKGSCLWASEIEEFPMAVTKVRFGE